MKITIVSNNPDDRLDEWTFKPLQPQEPEKTPSGRPRAALALIVGAVILVVAGVAIPMLGDGDEDGATFLGGREIVQILVLNGEAPNGDEGIIQRKVEDADSGDQLVIHCARGDWSIDVTKTPPEVRKPLPLGVAPSRHGAHEVWLGEARCARINWLKTPSYPDCVIAFRTPSYFQFELIKSGAGVFEGRHARTGQVLFTLSLGQPGQGATDEIHSDPNPIRAISTRIEAMLSFATADRQTRLSVQRSFQVAGLR